MNKNLEREREKKEYDFKFYSWKRHKKDGTATIIIIMLEHVSEWMEKMKGILIKFTEIFYGMWI